MSNPTPLDPRKRIILRAVILEYVAEGEPVGSELIAQKYELGVRSATVRNELAEMSELGYLEQPHTSAGRIPSDHGYRFYVDHMVEDMTPDQGQKQRVHEATQRSEFLKAVLQDTTKALSRLTHQLSAATTAGLSGLKVQSAVVTALGPTRAMLVVALSNGDVQSRILECQPGLTLEDFGRLNELLPIQLTNVSAKALGRLKNPQPSGKASSDKFVNAVFSSLRAIGKELSKGQLVMEGEEYVLAQPEFQRDSGLLREVLESLENEDLLSSAIQNQSGRPMMITIGRENDAPGMHKLSILRHSFYVGSEEAGTLAIIGTTRQDYQSGIALLRFTAEAIGHSLSKLLPGESI